MIEVSLLGPPRVERDRTRVAFETRKALALLALLATADRPRTRDALVDLLWPDSDPEHARAALRRTLSDLRNGIGGDLLEATPDHVRLVKGPDLTVDVDRFLELCRGGQAKGAVDLFRGDFLEGLAVRHAPDFEDWVQIEAAELRRQLTGALAVVTKEREAGGDLDEALSAARRWVETDPLHEPAHQALIRLYAATGNRAAALSQYRECVRTLSRELGVPPLSTTKELYEAVNRGTYVAPGAWSEARPAPETLPQPTRSPFVGRTREMQAAQAVYRSLDAAGRVLLVEGEAGIGKTRMVEELLAWVGAQGGRVLFCRAYEDEARLAYAPVVEALRARLREGVDWLTPLDARVVGEATRLVPELGAGRPVDVPPPLEGPGAESRFLSALWATLLAAVSGDRPGVLLVDDAQWADEATLSLLGYGLRRLAWQPLLVVLTWRSPYDHALRRRVASATHEGKAEVVRLGRLTPGDVERLLRELPAASSEDARRLWEQTEGVPLLLVEYLRATGAESDMDLPTAVRDVLHARLDPVSETGRQVLSAAAVLGRPFDLDTVRLVSARTDDETVAALEEAVARGLLVEGEDDYDFTHHLLRAVVHDQTSLARRRLLHGRAARIPGTPSATVARHLQLAGRDAEAAEAFRLAAGQAREVFANAEALDHLRAAIALGHPDRAGVLAEIADVQVVTGDYAAALQSLEEAAATTGPRELAGVELRLGRLRHRRGEYAVAAEHLEAALGAEAGRDPALRAAALVDLSLVMEACGDPGRAELLATEARSLAEASGDIVSLCRAHNALGVLATARGEIDVALENLERCRALAEEVADPALRAAALNNTALAHRARGDLGEALDLTREALDLCAAVGDRHREAALHNNLADLLHASGQDEAAMTHLKKAVETFADIGAEEEPQAGVWRLVRW